MLRRQMIYNNNNMPSNNNDSHSTGPKSSSFRASTTMRTTTRTRTRTRRITTITTTRTTEFWSFFTILLCCWKTVQTTNAISLLNGRYETSNDVTDYLNLALDAAKMNEADDFDTKLDLYKNVSVGRVSNVSSDVSEYGTFIKLLGENEDRCCRNGIPIDFRPLFRSPRRINELN